MGSLHGKKGGLLLPNEVRRFDLNRQLLSNMEEQLPLLAEQTSFNIRINQLRSVNRISEFLGKGGNQWNSGYIRQPTGAGKTVAYGLFARLFNVKTAIFVPKTILMGQTAEDLVKTIGIPERKIGFVGDRHYDIGKNKQILIGTYRSNLNRMGNDHAYTNEMNDTSLVICDEAHRSLGHKSARSLSQFGLGFGVRKEEIYNSSRLILGFTATTELLDKSVSDNYHELIAEEHYDDLVRAGILVPFFVTKAEASNIFGEELKNLTEKEEADILARENVYKKLIAAFLKTRETAEEPLYPIAFCANHKECEKFKAIAANEGLRCAIVTGYERKEDLQAVKKAEEALLRGEIDTMITVDLLTEGWNFPPANMAIMARAGQSPARIIQAAGRTGRAYDSAVNLDYAGIIRRPYKKTRSHVLEAEWNVTSRISFTQRELDNMSTPRRNKAIREQAKLITGIDTPLDLAQALAIFGEDPVDVVMGEVGKQLANVLRLDLTNGRAVYQGESVITATGYADDPSKNITKLKLTTLLSASVIRNELRPIPHIKAKEGRDTVLYREADLDRIVTEHRELEEIENKAEEVRLHMENMLGKYLLDAETDETVIEEHDNRVAIGIVGIEKNPVVQGKHFDLDTLRDWLSREKILPVPYLIRRPTKKENLTRRTRAYWKDEVERKIETIHSYRYILSKETDEAVIESEGGKVAIGIRGLYNIPAILRVNPDVDRLRRAVRRVGIEPVDFRTMQYNGDEKRMFSPASAYWKDEVEAKLSLIMDDLTGKKQVEGVERILKGADNVLVFEQPQKHPPVRKAMSSASFSKKRNIDPAVLKACIASVELESLPQSVVVPHLPQSADDVFWLDELESVSAMMTSKNGAALLPVKKPGKKSSIEMKTAMSLADFAAAIKRPVEDLLKTLAQKGIQPVTLSDCTQEKNVEIKDDRTVIKTDEYPTPLKYWHLALASKEEGRILVHTKNGQEHVYWLDQLEALVK